MDNDSGHFVETARSGDPIAIARALVATPSVNPSLRPGASGEKEIAQLALGLLRSWGVESRLVEVAPDRPNVVARLSGEGPEILLNGHLDTVGVDGMSVEPFAARLEGARLHGRGSCDMKGGVAAILAATRRLAASGPRPNVTVLLTVDEEHASIGMEAYVRDAPPSDFAVVCEPTNLAVMPAHKGFVWLRADFRGRAAHGSRADLGIDAIRHAGLYLAELDRYREDLRARAPHPLLGRPSFHAGTIAGGTAESVYPDRCRLVLERRTLPGEKTQRIEEEFSGVLERVRAREPDVDAALETTLDRPGTEVPDGHPLVRALLEASASRGGPSRVEGMSAWVDAAFLNEAGTPAVCYGPGSIGQAHTDDEWIDVEEIVTCAAVLETFARSLSAPAEPRGPTPALGTW